MVSQIGKRRVRYHVELPLPGPARADQRFRMRNTLTLLLVIVLACTGDPTGPGKVKAILIAPGVVLLTQAGATQQFAATAVDESGITVPGVSVTWRSSNSAIVRVDGSRGVATAVAKGSATIIAESSTSSGSASVTVHLPECVQPIDVTLVPGQMLVTDIPTSATCAVRLPAGSALDRYRVAIVRLTTTQEVTAPNAVLKLTPRGPVTTAAVTAPPAGLPPLVDAEQVALLRASSDIADATAAAHERMRIAEADLLRRLEPFGSPLPTLRAPQGPRAVAPAKKTFVPRLSHEGTCSLASKTPATGLLVAESASMAIYQDSTQAQNQPTSPANVQRMLDFYDKFGRVTIESYFGAVPDRDGNGQVVVFITPAVSGLVAAFVWGGDQLSTASCAASNEMELVYFNATLIGGMGGGNFQAMETLVHEVKHIVSFHHRLAGTTFNSHPTWIEEGTAEIAGEIATRKAWAAANGPAVNAVVTRQSFPSSGTRFTADNYGVYLRLFRTREYLTAQPNSLVFGPANDGYTIYGSGWHFSRFFGDAYGGAGSSPGADAALFLIQNAAATPSGLLGLEMATGGKTFDTQLVEYAGAVMLNGSGAPAPARGFTTYDFPSAISALSGTTLSYPYPVTAVGSSPSASYADRTWSGPIGNSGLRIHDFVAGATIGADITVQVEEPAKLVVVRLR